MVFSTFKSLESTLIIMKTLMFMIINYGFWNGLETFNSFLFIQMITKILVLQ